MGALFRGSNRLWFPGQVKPQGVPRIDWTNPLTNGLIFFGFDTGLGLIVDLVGGRPAQRIPSTTAASVSTSPWGTGFLWNGSDGRFFASDSIIQVAATNSNYPPVTWVCAYNMTGTVGSDTIPFGRTLNNGALGATNWNINLNTAGSGQNRVTANWGTGSGNVTGTNVWTSNANNQFASVAFTQAANGSTSTLWAQGVLADTQSKGTIQADNVNDAVMFSGASAAASLQPMTGFVYYGAFWTRALSQSELIQLYLDPYCFLMPAEGEWPALRSAASSTTYTPGAGSLTISGLTPSASDAASVSPAAGSIALSGQIPSLANAVTLTPGAGALTISGLIPSPNNAVSFTPGAGSLSLTGNIPSTTAIGSLSVGLGSFTLTGYAPTYVNSQGTLYTVGLGSLAITGLTPSATAASALRARLGGMTFSGQYPTIYAWFDVAPNAENWTPGSAGNTTWIATSPTVESWSSVTPIIDPWTKLPPSSGWS